ncbi:helix-turn-helix domain-containing protein [Kordia sp.]|uniref:helix-turn-helix domain-containing protein n=1 Tax=Kordia sp. TaxID=1965332 RepID=UPI003D6B79E0
MKLSFFIAGLLLFSFKYTLAQTDSLATKSFKELEDLYIESIYTSHKKAKVYADALYTIVQKGTNQKRISKALYRKGYINFKLGNTKEAHEYTEASLKIAVAINDLELLLQNYTQKGNIFLAVGTYKKAIEYYLKAKEIAKQTASFRDLITLTYNIGLIKKQIEDFLGAVQDFKNNLAEIEALQSSSYDRLEALNCLALADTYLRLENTDLADVYTTRGLQKASQEKYVELHADLSLSKVIILFQQKKYQQSIDLILSLKKTMQDINCKQKFSASYLYLGKNHFALQNIDSAIVYFEKIKSLTTTENFSFTELKEVYYHLAKSYSLKENTQKATENFKLFEDFSKENDLSNKKTYHTIKDYDISTLKKEISALNTQSLQQGKTVFYLYFIAGVLLILIIVFILIYKQKQHSNKKRFETLLKHIETIESSKKTLTPSKQKTDLAIDDKGVLEILEALEKFEEKEQFLHVDCNLSYTAKKLKTNTAYLSHVINAYKGKTFTVYLTELRINAALIGLKNNKKLQLYSMEAIANEFGFKRRETFSKIFKNVTGMQPSSYIKQLQESHEKSCDD